MSLVVENHARFKTLVPLGIMSAWFAKSQFNLFREAEGKGHLIGKNFSPGKCAFVIAVTVLFC